ncbi:MAG: PQQ-dependent dehydrogenase, methanol/ethanol family [Myxococcota bacterium]
MADHRVQRRSARCTRRRSPAARIAALFGVLLVASCSGNHHGAKPEDTHARTMARSETAHPTDAELRRADERRGDWLSHGRAPGEQRFSPLDQIDASNVGALGLAWTTETGTTRGMEATPLVHDGVMYVSGSWSIVLALDARTGEVLWRFDPEVPGRAGAHACCDVVNRGVALWQGRVFVGTLDGRLIALDAKSGAPLWETRTTDPEQDYAITGAPRIVKGRVLIGNGGADLGLRGYVSAYDAESGALVWRFYTVPGDPAQPQESPALERALATWQGGAWWEFGGGGTVWDSMAWDPELDLLYVGTGNGGPWTTKLRSRGDNLYLASILALRPDTGELVWHYQTTPGEIWDYTATQHILLADLEIGGRPRKVLLQAPKNGFFYVLDRATGELLSAEPYVPVTWASHVDRNTGRPVETPEARYAGETVVLRPSAAGGHNWHPMSFHPGTGLVYFPIFDVAFGYREDPEFVHRKGFFNTGVDPVGGSETMVEGRSLGALIAWDPRAAREVWRVEHRHLANGGTLATAGELVFQGTGAGTMHAYRAGDGTPLWEAPTGTGVIAPPISYAVDGEQYVAVVAGIGGGMGLASGDPPPAVLESGNAGRVLAWKLGGDARLPLPDPARSLVARPVAAIDEALDPSRVEAGRRVYTRHCGHCHGPHAISGGVVPDLRRSLPPIYEALPAIVLEGGLLERGMPSFAGILDEAALSDVRQYLLSRRAALLAESSR